MGYILGFYLIIGLAAALVAKEQLEKEDPLVMSYPTLKFMIVLILTVWWPTFFTDFRGKA